MTPEDSSKPSRADRDSRILALITHKDWHLVAEELYQTLAEQKHFSPLSKRQLNEVTTWGTWGECQAYIMGRNDLVAKFAVRLAEIKKRVERKEKKIRQKEA